MKKITYILLSIIISGCFASCNKWLDVMPEDTSTEAKLFSEYGGFRTALNGIYTEMSMPEFYGCEMTWGFASALGQYYNQVTAAGTPCTYYETERLNFNSFEVERYTFDIWQKAYNIVANCNNLLQHLRNFDPNKFPQGKAEADLIEGEALAVRALMHFEMLRLFAPAPITEKGSSRVYIPYVEVYPSKFNPKLTVDKCLENIIRDFKEALVKTNYAEIESGITRLANHNNRSISLTGDMFFGYRINRLNVINIEAYLAKVYMYANDHENAFKYAKNVYTKYVKGEGERNWYEYNSMSLIGSATALTCSKLGSDVLFGGYSKTLIEKYEKATGNRTTYNHLSLKELPYYSSDQNDYRTSLGSGDINGGSGGMIGRMNIVGVIAEISVKHLWKNAPATTDDVLIPVFRMSEIALIMAECYYEKGDYTNASKYIEVIKNARNTKQELYPEIGEELILTELHKEIWKENLSEGAEPFFFFKRRNENLRVGSTIIEMTPEKYVIPVPLNDNMM